MNLKTLLARTAALLLAVGIFSLPAAAANTGSGPPQTIDPDRTGSIIVHKYAEDDFLATTPELTPEQLAAYLLAHPDGLTPVAGVVFRYTRIADLVQYTVRTEDETGTVSSTVKLGYAVDKAAAEFLGLDEADADAVGNGALCYDASLLDAALDRKTATETEAFVAERDADYMPATDENGVATADQLSLGLYLVCEWSYPATATADDDHCAPFLVSLPFTGADGAGWVYDADVTPKNLIDVLHNDKVILGTDGNETKEYDAEINEAVDFLIRSDVPNAIGKLSLYRIVDTLSAGLTYDEGSYTVYGVAGDGARTLLLDSRDFTFTQDIDANTMVFNFVPSSLADSEGWAVYGSVEIYYTAHLNENAVVGGEGNPNSLRTEYSRSTNVETEPDVLIPHEDPRVYTYAINVHKVAGDTKAGLAGVTFQLLDRDGNEIRVSEQTPGVDGAYYLDPDGTATLTTGEDGNLFIKGVEAGVYYLKETATVSGYLLPGGKIEIVITSNENSYTRDDAGTFAMADPEQTYYTDLLPEINCFTLPLTADLQRTVPAGTFVCFGASGVWTLPDGAAVEMYRADKLAWSSNYAMGESRDEADTGVVKLEIINSRPNLPNTGGGDGDYWPIVISSCVAAAGAVLFALSFRKHKSEY